MHKNRLFIPLHILTVVMILSCTSSPVKGINHAFAENTENQEESDNTASGKGFNNFPEAVWNMTDNDEYLYFTGISPFYINKKISDELLLEDASESAAVFEGVFGFSGKITEKSGSGTRTGASFNYIYSDSSFKYYMENLETVSTYKKNESIFRIFRIQNSMKLPSLIKSSQNYPPLWINKLPEIEGFSFSIGISGRYSRISESVRNADASSLEEMIKQKNISVFTDSGYNNFSSRGIEYASSELKGFYIIRRWWSPDLRNFYSLGMIDDSLQ